MNLNSKGQKEKELDLSPLDCSSEDVFTYIYREREISPLFYLDLDRPTVQEFEVCIINHPYIGY